MKFLKQQKKYILILAALLICAFAATAAFAEKVIDVTTTDHETTYAFPDNDGYSGDVTIKGERITNDSRRLTLLIGKGYENTITLDAVNIQETGVPTTAMVYLFEFTHQTYPKIYPSAARLSLSGDSTILTTHIPPIYIDSTEKAGTQNKLIIGGTGRLTVTGTESPDDSQRSVPAIGAAYSNSAGGESYTGDSGSIVIESGYIIATGYKAPAIGYYMRNVHSNYGERIRISGGIIEAKTIGNDAMPSIGMYRAGTWYETYITSGSISADIGNPVNDNESQLSRYSRNFGPDYAGNEYSFEVFDSTTYTYTFSVPDDGVAWLWVPADREEDIPLVPQTTLTGESNSGPIELTATVESGTPDSYRWFKAESESGDFIEIPGASEAAYTDYDVTIDNTYWYKTIPVYSSGYFNGIYSNTVSVKSQSEDVPGIEPKLSLAGANGEVELTLDMEGGMAAEYKWFRATSASGPFTEIAATAVPNYTDKDVTVGTSYWYYAEADGVQSDIKKITINDAGAGDRPLLTLANENQAVKLTLDMRARVAQEYKWFRGTSKDGPFAEIATTTAPSHIDKNVTVGTTYWYYATADDMVSDVRSITLSSKGYDYSCSSGGCNAGSGALALFGLLTPVVVYLRKRGS